MAAALSESSNGWKSTFRNFVILTVITFALQTQHRFFEKIIITGFQQKIVAYKFEDQNIVMKPQVRIIFSWTYLIGPFYPDSNLITPAVLHNVFHFKPGRNLSQTTYASPYYTRQQRKDFNAIKMSWRKKDHKVCKFVISIFFFCRILSKLMKLTLSIHILHFLAKTFKFFSHL